MFCLCLLVAGTAALLYHASQDKGFEISSIDRTQASAESQPERKVTPTTLYDLNKGNPLGIKLAGLFEPETNLPASMVKESNAGEKPNYFEFARVHAAAAEEFCAENFDLEHNRFAKAITHFEQFLKYLKADMNSGKRTDSDMFFYSVAYGLTGMAVAELNEREGALQQLQTAIYSDPKIQDNYIVRCNVFKLMGDDRQVEVWRNKALQAPQVKAYPTWAQSHKLLQMPPASK